MTSRAASWCRRVPPLPRPSDVVLDRLWVDVADAVPAAATFARLASWFAADHVALRTVARPGSGIPLLSAVFERRGWRPQGEPVLAADHVRTVQLAREGFASIVIRELDARALPADARAAVLRLPADAPPPDDDVALAAWFKAPLPPSAADLELLDRAAPFGAWLLAFGRRVHHLAVAVADIDEWLVRLRALGVPMAGPVEGAPDAPVRRLVTTAAELDVRLRDGTNRRRACCHLELTERAPGFQGVAAPGALPCVVRDGMRRHARVTTALQVDLGYGGRLVPVVSENVSLGGMFLQLPDEEAPAAHAALQLTIELPAGPIEALATVIYRVPGRGVGVEFQWWDDEDNAGRRALAEHLRSVA